MAAEAILALVSNVICIDKKNLLFCLIFFFLSKQYLYCQIHKEREGEQIDRELVRNVIDVFVENGMGTLKKYEEDFERLMLQDTASYYSSKASRWIQEESCLDYTLKAYL